MFMPEPYRAIRLCDMINNEQDLLEQEAYTNANLEEEMEYYNVVNDAMSALAGN
jgi:hypothetical protein